MSYSQEFESDTGRPFGGVSDSDLKTWLAAVAAVRPGSGLRNPMQLQSAIMLIAGTSPGRRSQFAAEIARRKRARQHVAAAAVAV